MFALNAENRNMALKPKQLRREGMVPGVLYGKNLKESLSLQLSQAEALRFLQANFVGSKAEITVGGNKYPALLREVSYMPATDKLEHLSFQALIAGEEITSTALIVLTGKEKVSGVIQQQLSEISYRTLPSNLVDRIEINLEGMKAGVSMRVGDLDIAKNSDIEILSPLDDMVFSIVDGRKPAAASEADEEAAAE